MFLVLLASIALLFSMASAEAVSRVERSVTGHYGTSIASRDLAPGDLARAPAASGPGMLPDAFVENLGQEDPRVAFTQRLGDTSVYFAAAGVTIALEEGASRWAVKSDFVGARAVQPVGVRRGPTTVSYFTGSPDEWITGVRTYSEIVYEDLWPGIDLVYLAQKGGLKYEFHVSPGADPSAIGLSYQGASSLRLDQSGAIEVTTPSGTFADQAPFSYQSVGRSRVPVASRYSLVRTRIGFELGRYDRTRTLVIDPVVVLQSGYVGGAALDEAYAVDVDAAGNSYVTGVTESPESSFPVAAGPDLTYNDAEAGDAFVAKVNAAGTNLAYLGYIGGSGADAGWDIAVDGSGAAYVTGQTGSSQASFPILGGPDTTFNDGGADAFIAKIAPSGASLSYSGYIGGASTDAGNGVAVDGSGAAYIVGETESSEASFPEVGGPDLTYNGLGDAFVAKVSATGSSLAYAGYLGGSDWDFGTSIGVDASGAAYLSGMAASTQASFPEVVGPDLTHNGGGDAFVAKVAPAGNSLSYAGYVGGAAWDAGWGIAVDNSGSAHLVGDTESSEATFPVRNGPDVTYNGSSDAFAAKLTANGGGLSYAGYVGGSGNDYAGYHGVTVDGLGNAYTTGITNSASGFPTTAGPDLTHNGANDAYVTKLSSSGAFVYAGFIGGSQFDAGYGIAVDSSRVAYVVGGTNSTESTFPVSGGPDSTFNDIGIGDAFVTKVGTIHPLTVTKGGSGPGTVTSSPAGINCGGDCTESYLEGSSVTLTATAGADSRFAGWSGACSGTEATCQVSLDAPKTVTATFLETIPPETTITSGPATRTNDSSAHFAFSSNEAGSTFACSLDGGPFEACTQPKSYFSLNEGPHEFQVRATDGSGNTDATPAVRTWTVDLTPPDTALTSGPSGINTSSDASFAFSSTESPATFSCSLDGGEFTPCSSTKTYTGLPDGNHVFRVRAVDQAGNIDPSPATRSWTVDARGPIISFRRPIAGLYVNDQSFGGQGPIFVVGHVTVEARADDLESGVSSFGFSVNGTPVSQVTFQNGIYSFSFRPTSAGQYTIGATSTNGSGISSSTSITVFGSPSQ